jgi:cation transport ATPase
VPYCQKCGTEIREEMAFCPKCGAPLKAEQPPVEAAPAPAPQMAEKAEKREKREKEEKREKTEKHEKREFGVIGPLVGGLILVFLGLTSYLQVSGLLRTEVASALFFIIIGIIIVVGSIYAALMASRRHPRT